MAYADFLAGKARMTPATGLAVVPPLHPALFPFQRDITAWALRRGRAAIFADCGLGKTLMQLVWADHVPGRTLILAPLAVADQTVREGARFGIGVHYARSQAAADGHRIVVTNYEMLAHFDPTQFTGVVLDESSILKSYDGATRTAIIEAFSQTPFRLACTATPAPNDFMELGNHAEFLGTMTRAEMLAMFFVHDGGDVQQWRLKGHAQSVFWRWLCSWAVTCQKPSDLGYDDDGFTLPAIRYHQHHIAASRPTDGFLLALPASSLSERISARRETVADRVAEVVRLVNTTPGTWVVWCGLNSESTALAAGIPDAIEVTGSDSIESKEQSLAGFADGSYRVIITKPSIAGFGMNWQHCHQMAFVGLSDSWEQYYQAVRRCWRFGQSHEVDVHVITADTEGAVVANIKRKEADAERMAQEMVSHMHDLKAESLHGGTVRSMATYERDVKSDERWTAHLGDCVEVASEIPTDSIPYSVFSPPFASLYTYSNSDRDMGNCNDHASFYDHFGYLVRELYRATMPGRLVSIHCMNLPTSKVRDGVIGLRDFRGEIIRMFEAYGFIFHSEVCIWKDPVTAMQRTKALGLLYKQIKKDSAMSRQGIPDYLVTMRKPGENPQPVTKTPDDFPVTLWQRYASPVWMDINPNETLQYRSARENDDERHICPLQLDVIRRAIRLWSNPGDTVLSPFAGIGSEGYVALELGRNFFGIELKRSYWEVQCRNLAAATEVAANDLFAATGV